MTPKEKAMQIFNKMCNSVDELLPFDVKECALISIDDTISILENLYGTTKEVAYYKKVKKEIEKL